jgi:hypothetical protein
MGFSTTCSVAEVFDVRSTLLQLIETAGVCAFNTEARQRAKNEAKRRDMGESKFI